MNKNAMFRFGYGLYLITTVENGFDNGCIINAAMQITDEPARILIAINKRHKTHDMILDTGIFNVSMIAENASKELFTRFGYQSGRNINKFSGFEEYARSENGVTYLTRQAGAYVSGSVLDTIDFGSHTIFLADVTDAEILSDFATVTYSFYQEHLKP